MFSMTQMQYGGIPAKRGSSLLYKGLCNQKEPAGRPANGKIIFLGSCRNSRFHACIMDLQCAVVPPLPVQTYTDLHKLLCQTTLQ